MNEAVVDIEVLAAELDMVNVVGLEVDKVVGPAVTRLFNSHVSPLKKLRITLLLFSK